MGINVINNESWLTADYISVNNVNGTVNIINSELTNAIPSGVYAYFKNNAAPFGWTKITEGSGTDQLPNINNALLTTSISNIGQVNGSLFYEHNHNNFSHTHNFPHHVHTINTLHYHTVETETLKNNEDGTIIVPIVSGVSLKKGKTNNVIGAPSSTISSSASPAVTKVSNIKYYQVILCRKN